MERPIKGGYILISLGLIALTVGASLTLDYERITKTKKHIVLTGIKVADTIMPDLTVKPIFGNGTITFSDVYGYDIVVSSNGSASVSEHTSGEVPNVEEAPDGAIVKYLGLDISGKVVKGTSASSQKIWKHSLYFSSANINIVLFNREASSYTGQLTTSYDIIEKIERCLSVKVSEVALLYYSSNGPTGINVRFYGISEGSVSVKSVDISDLTFTDTVTEY